MCIAIALYFIFWILCGIGAVIVFFVVLRQRIKEKKIEKEKHKEYEDY
ncbi:hypothetical protein [Cellulosilyticum ruminicola]|nr:hypothetical protein [Cellulosilyticum ruminicola]